MAIGLPFSHLPLSSAHALYDQSQSQRLPSHRQHTRPRFSASRTGVTPVRPTYYVHGLLDEERALERPRNRFSGSPARTTSLLAATQPKLRRAGPLHVSGFSLRAAILRAPPSTCIARTNIIGTPFAISCHFRMRTWLRTSRVSVQMVNRNSLPASRSPNVQYQKGNPSGSTVVRRLPFFLVCVR